MDVRAHKYTSLDDSRPYIKHFWECEEGIMMIRYPEFMLNANNGLDSTHNGYTDAGAKKATERYLNKQGTQEVKWLS